MNSNYIYNCFKWLTNELVMYYLDRDLPKDLMRKIDEFYKSVASTFDWFDLSEGDLLKLGFLNWDDGSEESQEPSLWFIPLWLYPTIPLGMKLMSSEGKLFEFHPVTASRSVMFGGYLSFGVVVHNKENKNVNS